MRVQIRGLHHMPASVSDFAVNKPFEKIRGSFSSISPTAISPTAISPTAISPTASPQEIEEIISKIRDANKLGFLSRIIDRLFYHSQKQFARDQFVILSIVSEACASRLSPSVKELIAQSIGKMDCLHGQGQNSSLEEEAALALHYLQKGTKLDYVKDFQKIWTVRNIEFKDNSSPGDKTNDAVQMTASVELNTNLFDSDYGEQNQTLSFNIKVADIRQNTFVLNYMASDISSLDEKKKNYSDMVKTFNESRAQFKDKYSKYQQAKSKFIEAENEFRHTSVEVAQNISEQLNHAFSVNENIYNSLVNSIRININTLKQQSESLEMWRTRTSQLKQECIPLYNDACIKAEETRAVCQAYHEPAMAYYRVGTFLNENRALNSELVNLSELQASFNEKWVDLQKTLPSPPPSPSPSSLELRTAQLQKPALKTFVFLRLAQNDLEEMQQLKNKLYGNCDIVNVDPLLQDSRGTESEYAEALDKCFDAWQKASQAFKEHTSKKDAAVTQSKMVINDAFQAQNSIKNALNDLCNYLSKPSTYLNEDNDSLNEGILRNRFINDGKCDFSNKFILFEMKLFSSHYQKNHAEMNKEKEKISKLLKEETDFVNALNNAQLALCSAAEPYERARLIVGEEYDQLNSQIRLENNLRESLNTIQLLAVDTILSDMQILISDFEENHNNIVALCEKYDIPTNVEKLSTFNPLSIWGVSSQDGQNINQNIQQAMSELINQISGLSGYERMSTDVDDPKRREVSQNVQKAINNSL